MAYGAFIVGGGGTIPRIGDAIVTTVKTSPAARYKNTTWELVAQNRVPMGAGDGHKGGETVEAGLPNITGNFSSRPHMNGNFGTGGSIVSADGKLFVHLPQASDEKDNSMTETGRPYKNDVTFFDASRSNPIYGNSTTVQPPAYYFYFWRRVS